MMLAAGYLLVLSQNRNSFHENINNEKGAYSTAWLSLPCVMTAVYLTGVWGLTKYFEGRKPMQGLKDYMFTYNLYQVRGRVSPRATRALARPARARGARAPCARRRGRAALSRGTPLARHTRAALSPAQVIINVWCVVAFVLEVRRAGMSAVGNKVDLGPNSFRLGFVTWVHYNNKYVELLDTLWMVLRKKTQQVSFLHVYHHVLLIWAWFCVVKLCNGGDAYFGGLLNSIIHVLMYSYYTMALLGWSCPWKRYLTQAQLVQFCVCLGHATWAAVTGVYPFHICLVEIWVMLSMLYLFTKFYNSAYTPPKGKGEAKGGAASGAPPPKQKSVKAH